eukprot:tig00021463_g21632.t1
MAPSGPAGSGRGLRIAVISCANASKWKRSAVVYACLISDAREFRIRAPSAREVDPALLELVQSSACKPASDGSDPEEYPHDPTTERWSGDEYIVFSAPDGQLPTADALSALEGVVISGSPSSAYSEAVWVANLREWIREFYRRYLDGRVDGHGPRLLGVCFGHQVIAHALGGLTARGPGFCFGAENVEPNEDFYRLPYVQEAVEALGGAVPHGDEVAKLPPGSGAVVVASSPSCRNEAFAIGDGLLTFQGHPELAAGHVNDLILPALVANGILTEEEGRRSQEQLARRVPGRPEPPAPGACPLCARLLAVGPDRSFFRGRPEGERMAASGLQERLVAPDMCDAHSHRFLSTLIRAFFARRAAGRR